MYTIIRVIIVYTGFMIHCRDFCHHNRVHIKSPVFGYVSLDVDSCLCEVLLKELPRLFGKLLDQPGHLARPGGGELGQLNSQVLPRVTDPG